MTPERSRVRRRRGPRARVAPAAVVAVALIATAVLYVRLRVLVAEIAAPGVGPRHPRLVSALALGRTFPHVQPIEPFGLTTRLPDGWECHLADWSKATKCASRDWSVHWIIEAETSEVSTESLIAWSHPDPNEKGDQPEGPGHVEDLSLAGFRGFMTVTTGSRRPSHEWHFTGWFDDAERGRLRLRISASWRLRGGVNAAYDSLDGLAILLGTTSLRPDPGGPAVSWPSDEERAPFADADSAFHRLKDEENPSGWAGAARKLARKLPSTRDRTPRGLVAEPLRDRKHPSVTELLALRAAQLVDSGETSEGVDVANALATWDPVAARPVLVRIHERLGKLLDEALAGEARELQLVQFARLAESRVGAGDRAGLQLLIARMSAWLPVDLPDAVLSILGDLRQEPEVGALLDRWFGSTSVIPRGSHHAALARLAARSARDDPRLRRFVLAELGNKTTAQETRLCDVYASALSQTKGAPKFEWNASAADRDRAIGALAVWLRGVAPDAPLVAPDAGAMRPAERTPGAP